MGRIQERYGTAALRHAAAVVAVQEDIAGVPERARSSSAGGSPTGIPELDALTSVGGLPLGRISLCLGSPGSGTMLVGCHFLARSSQDYAAVLMLDLRGHVDPWLLSRLGARLDRVLVLRPPYGDGPTHAARIDAQLRTALEATLSLLRAGMGSVVADLPGDLAMSGVWDPFAASLSAACARAGAPLLLLAEQAPTSLRYAASVVLRLRHEEWLLRHGDIDGVRSSATVEKNKVGIPGGVAEVRLRYPREGFAAPAVASVPRIAAEAALEPGEVAL